MAQKVFWSWAQIMIRAGALYFAIVIAFFIAVVSASLIMLAAHYRNGYLRELRFNRLVTNLNSGIAFVLEDRVKGNKTIDLFYDSADSLNIQNRQWGFYDLAILKSFIQQDTLKKAFLIGSKSDSTVLYLSDEDRPLSVSGQTKITGNAVLPKAGMKKSYAEGKPYAGEKLIYGGKTSFSARTLEPVDQDVLMAISRELGNTKMNLPLLETKELRVSFLDSTKRYRLKEHSILANVDLQGNIIIYADSSITISANSKLSGIQVYAPFIVIESGFRGDCQFFASDSIVIGNKVMLSYPSVAAVIRNEKSGTLPKIVLGDKVSFEGILFTYEAKRSPLQTLISLGKNTHVKGEVYSAGLFKLERGVVLDGKVSCNRFIMQTPTTLYENFLIDVEFNRLSRNRYYLSSRIFGITPHNKVLKWLN